MKRFERSDRTVCASRGSEYTIASRTCWSTRIKKGESIALNRHVPDIYDQMIATEYVVQVFSSMKSRAVKEINVRLWPFNFRYLFNFVVFLGVT